MVGQPEHPVYDPTVYEYEQTDPVQGGVGGIANLPLLNLSNRTAYLKQRLDLLIAGAIIPPTVAPLNGPAFTGSTTAPNVRPGDDSTLIANTDFVQTRHHGIAVVSVGGNTNVTLTQDQWGVGILVLQGVVTGALSVLFPRQAGRWIVQNVTTGTFALTVATAAGTGTVVPRGGALGVWCDGTNIYRQDALSIPISQTFRTSGTFVVPAIAGFLKIRLWGGGGGGGGAAGANSTGAGGAGAGYAEGNYIVPAGASLTVTVGASGAGGAIGGVGGNGGTSSVTGLISALGGTGGNGAAPGQVAGGVTLPGTGSGGSILNVTGQPGGTAVQISANSYISGVGGPSYGSAGSSFQASSGTVAMNGGGGFGFGSGGSGGISGGGGGPGAPGCVIIEWLA